MERDFNLVPMAIRKSKAQEERNKVFILVRRLSVINAILTLGLVLSYWTLAIQVSQSGMKFNLIWHSFILMCFSVFVLTVTHRLNVFSPMIVGSICTGGVILSQVTLSNTIVFSMVNVDAAVAVASFGAVSFLTLLGQSVSIWIHQELLSTKEEKSTNITTAASNPGSTPNNTSFYHVQHLNITPPIAQGMSYGEFLASTVGRNATPASIHTRENVTKKVMIKRQLELAQKEESREMDKEITSEAMEDSTDKTEMIKGQD